MYQQTLGDVKPQLASVAAQTGLKTTDARLVPKINSALQMLMESADLPLLTDKIRFTITNRTVTLPFDRDRIMQANLDNQPIGYRSPWFEYLEMGVAWTRPTQWEDTRNLLMERNESPTRTLLPNEDTDPDYNIVFKAFVDETVGATLTPVINIRGYDENNEWIRTEYGGEWIDGENVELSGSAPLYEAVTTKVFSVIESVVKPITLNHIKILARDGVAADVELSDYRHNETVPSYRTYFIPSLIDGQDYVLDARVKSRFIPVQHDNDLMPVSNVTALKFAMIAQHKVDVGKPKDFDVNYALAEGILSKEAGSYRGKSKTPAFSFRGRIGIGQFSGF